VVGDMLAGRPAIYTTFLAYDEVAHHSGIERPDALETLRRVDRQIARVAKAAQAAPRPYRFVVLSDHGQSQGETFLDRYGLTLEELVQSLTRGDTAIDRIGAGEDDAQAYMNATVTEAANEGTLIGRLLGRFSRRQASAVVPASEPDTAKRPRPEAAPPELSVMASGCLGLIDFPREPGRVTIERLEELHPALVDGLKSHPGIGFVLVDSERYGPLAIGAKGTHHLDSGKVEGEDPLAPFGENARAHVLRTHGFPHCPDILVNSTYWAETDEVAAFEELVGSHGGMGGTQSYPFVVHPVDLRWPEDGIVGSEGIYHLFTGWMEQLRTGSGDESAQASGIEAPGSSTVTATAGESSAT